MIRASTKDRWWIWMLPVILLLCCICGCDFKAASKVASEIEVDFPSEGPQSRVRQIDFDFGLVDADSKHPRIVEFTNDSTEAIHLADVGVSCGCLHVESYPEVILPGATGSIELTFDANQKSMVNKTRVMFSDEHGVPVVFLDTVATVRSYSTSPQNVGLSELSKSKANRQTFAVLGAGHSDAQVIEATSNADWLSVSIESMTGSTQHEHVMAIARCTVTADHTRAPLGALTAELRLKIRDEDDQQELVVPVFGNHYGNVTLTPARIVFGSMKKKVVKRSCQIDFFDAVDAEGVEVTSDHAFVKASIVDRPSRQRLTIMVAAYPRKEAPAGLFKGNITGRVDGKETVFVVTYMGLLIGDGGNSGKHLAPPANATNDNAEKPE